MGLKCFKRWKPCDLADNVISNKCEYLKTSDTISMAYNVDPESYILGISLEKFLKETIEIQSVESESKVELVGSKHFLKNIERSENSESSNSFESFKDSENSTIGKDTVH